MMPLLRPRRSDKERAAVLLQRTLKAGPGGAAEVGPSSLRSASR